MKLAFGSTLLDRDQNSAGLDGIGQYCQALLNQFINNPALNTNLVVKPFSFGVKNTFCQAQILPPYPTYAIQALIMGPNSAANNFFKKIDLIHATDQLIPLVNHVPIIATIYDTIPLSHPQFLKIRSRYIKPKIWKALTQRANHIIAISEFSKNSIMEYFKFPEKHISVIPIGVSENYYESINTLRIEKTLFGFNITKPFFLFIGSIQPRKNIKTLLDAHARLPKNLALQYPLVIAGKLAWSDSETLATISLAMQEGRCHWLKYVSEFEKRCLLQSALALVLVSLYEGFGMPIIEAFASGLPVVTSNCTAMSEVADQAALLVNPHEQSDITEALLALIESETMRLDLKRAGLKRARLYSWESNAKATIQAYQAIL